MIVQIVVSCKNLIFILSYEDNDIETKHTMYSMVVPEVILALGLYAFVFAIGFAVPHFAIGQYTNEYNQNDINIYEFPDNHEIH